MEDLRRLQRVGAGVEEQVVRPKTWAGEGAEEAHQTLAEEEAVVERGRTWVEEAAVVEHGKTWEVEGAVAVLVKKEEEEEEDHHLAGVGLHEQMLAEEAEGGDGRQPWEAAGEVRER